MAGYNGKYTATAQSRGRKLPAVLLVVLLLLGSASAVLAYYLRQTGALNNSFTLSQVSCKTIEDTDEKTTEKTLITVQNTSNVPVYIRVRLVSYWQTPSGNITGVYDNIIAPKLETLGLLNSKWLADKDNDTYYYTLPLAVGETTDNLLANKIILVKPEDNEGYIQVIEVLAEAIQAEPAEAVTTAWGVTVNADGSIGKP